MREITEHCTGCGTCRLLCAKKAISFVPDKEGFLQPCIDDALCIDCGLCYKKCPQNASVAKSDPYHVLALRYKDNDILWNSASGGAFIGMARYVVGCGGVVFGVGYDSEWNAHHIAVDNIEDLKVLQSSKYVQANTGDTYCDVKRLLNAGRVVLYSGTACQIAGLKAYLNRDYDNLITMDLICHGVSSPLLFKKYIEWLGNKYGGKIIFYDFRDKTGGWGLGYRAKTKTKTKTRPSTLDPYYYHFLKGDTYRECCYHCRYCTKGRVGDITIGDYWGIEHEHPKFFDVRGVSVILINTKRGERYFTECEDSFHTCKSSFEQALRKNHNLKTPTTRPATRDRIYDRIDEEDYFDTVLAYPKNIKAVIKGIIPMRIKLWLKKSVAVVKS